MTDVKFYPFEGEYPLEFAAVYAVLGEQAVWCRRRGCEAWEFPCGRIESGETALGAAERELRAAVGATQFALEPMCVYSVAEDGAEVFGALFFADVFAFGPLGDAIEEIAFAVDPPGEWADPEVQPLLRDHLCARPAPVSKWKPRLMRLLAVMLAFVLMFAGAMMHRMYRDKDSYLWTNPVVKRLRVWHWHGNKDYAAAMARLRRADPEAAAADRIDRYSDRQGYWFFCREESEGMSAFASGSLWYVNRKGAHLLYRGDDIVLDFYRYIKDERIFRFETGKSGSRQAFSFIAGSDGPIQLELPDAISDISSLSVDKFACASVEPTPYDCCFLTLRDGKLHELAGVEMELDQFRTIPGAPEVLDSIATEQPTASITNLIWRDNGVITLNFQYDDGKLGHMYTWMDDGALTHWSASACGFEIVVEDGLGSIALNIDGLPVIESTPYTPAG